MTIIRSKHDAPLGLPGGAVLAPGAEVRVTNWDHMKNSDIIKAWLAVGAIEVDHEVEKVEAPMPARRPAPAPKSSVGRED